ncbi:MAG: hypothetical protein OIF56_01590 [Cohaesibacter sp.]|nr:hypothetical protein [Cohaesibacter sp.]
MDASGEFKIAASPAAVRQIFHDPELFCKVVPNCQRMRQIGIGLFEAEIAPAIDQQSELLIYQFQVQLLEKDKAIELSWSTKEPLALLPAGCALLTLTAQKGYTRISHQVQMTVNVNAGGGQGAKGQGIAFVSALMDRFADMLREQTGEAMHNKQHKKDFDYALTHLEEAAIELEEQAEVAAGKGVLGGVQMWGLLALALVILLLLMLT